MRCALIDVEQAVARLDRLYRDRALLKSKSEASRRFAESYSWSRLTTPVARVLEPHIL
jgi:hypothetical protein